MARDQSAESAGAKERQTCRVNQGAASLFLEAPFGGSAKVLGN
jgi:hypothetical protein